MRGFPLLNLIIALLLSGAVLLPLVNRATRIDAAQVAAAKPSPAADAVAQSVPARVSLRFVHAPAQVTVSADGKVLLSYTGSAELAFEETVPLPLSENRIELTAVITWPPGTPDSVAELTVEPEGLESRTANIWSSNAAADELVSFSWKGGAR